VQMWRLGQYPVMDLLGHIGEAHDEANTR
jgi:hypothetical protein